MIDRLTDADLVIYFGAYDFCRIFKSRWGPCGKFDSDTGRRAVKVARKLGGKVLELDPIEASEATMLLGDEADQ